MNEGKSKNNLIQAEPVKYEPLGDPFEDHPPITIPIDMNEYQDEIDGYIMIIIGGIMITLTMLISAYLAYTG